MIRATLAVDDAVGETRRVLLDMEGRPLRIAIERWRERGLRAQLDDIRWGRLGKRLPDGGWFVDLGVGPDGVLKTSRKSLSEGLLVAVRVKSEAWADKGPALSLADASSSKTPAQAEPGLISAAPDDPLLAGAEITGVISGREARDVADAAIEDGLARIVAIPGGGDLSIEPTRALVAVDVDAGARKPGNDPDLFALNLNLAAAEEIARQVSLRGLGGVVVVDFLGMTPRGNRKAVTDAFGVSLARALGRASQVLELSPLGLCEAAVARRCRPLVDALGADPVEREALDTLRLLESAGWSSPGRMLRARVAPDAFAWLQRDSFGWQAALADRIGARWTLEAAQRSPGAPDVWSET